MRLCVPIIGPSLEEAEQQLARAGPFVELRFDLLVQASLRWIRKTLDRRVIFKVTSLEQAELLAPLGPDYLDLDISELSRGRPRLLPRTQLICSSHHFQETPPAPFEGRPAADIQKVAAKAHSALDALRLLDAVRRHPSAIGVAMGEDGLATRLLAPKVGSPFTYAALDAEHLSAPGQPTCEEIARYPEVSPSTHLYGVIGNPIRQSRSPAFHNALFLQKGIDAVYLPLRLEACELGEALNLLRKLDLKGLSVTMPLKQEIGAHLDWVEGPAINTVSVEGERLLGYNTDGMGALDAIGPVQGKMLVILGTGGTAQAVAAEARQRGAYVTLMKRGSFDQLESYDILVNCTPVGMSSDETPVAAERLIPGTLVLDAVISETRLLREAKARGCRTISGLEMFQRQALYQQQIWQL